MDDDLKTSRHAGVVEAYDLDEGSASVRLDAGMTVFARITPAVRNIKVGNRVTLEKTVPGGVWRLVEKNTYDPPPKVSGSMGTKPANASTASGSASSVSGSNMSQVPTFPDPPTSNVGSTLEWVIVWAENTRAYLISLNSSLRTLRNRVNTMIGQVNDLRAAVNNHATQIERIQTALNTNATRLNQTRDYAETAGDLVTPVVDVLDDQGVLKKGD